MAMAGGGGHGGWGIRVACLRPAANASWVALKVPVSFDSSGVKYRVKYRVKYDLYLTLYLTPCVVMRNGFREIILSDV